mmetsp:Transcript_17716/g.53103  ORF Transcript_17716/g.53103 Transcript_17716/m.53103 type:complete len:779 (+) Transcript_17716:136-2472(+)|eukprot:CAMPEP_0174234670 /NCGR_PEP_ID=MMETSP0417-20130205/4356_1 /TAXON_ID=242541 /ORGANISM="Mayorella sp, Strain BSH-02190019" /LENGTH=778 /DNA_ID=CAMNT_0015313063 /DNA_START=122 /DNA_END=2458 /DNA_ORIENTATION=+
MAAQHRLAGAPVASSSSSAPAAAGRPRGGRTQSLRFSVQNLFSVIKGQDQETGDRLAQTQDVLNDLKGKISASSKKNFTLEKEISNLDKKISLLVRNRITLEEVMAQSGDISLINRTISLKDKHEREFYGQLFALLQKETRYIGQLTRLIKLAEIDNLLQTVMFTLYGNQYDEAEEHILLSMFRLVLEEEFRLAKSVSNLLRANSALTRMMTTYTRRGPGQQYLKKTLTTVLTEITSQSDLILEVNPLKVYEAMINQEEARTGQISTLNRKPTAEEAAANPDVQAIIGPRIKQLTEIADRFISAFIDSIADVPYGIRWICQQIRLLTKTSFPDATRNQTCSLIGGFYLLRFVNPAIVTPQAFMLVNSKLSANTRRNLTLLAKILQNLANNIRFGGVKEFFMEPLNAVLDRNRERVNSFLEEMTRVEDLQEHLNLDKYIALGRNKDPVINISLNEMYFIHGLLQSNLDTIAPDPTGADFHLHRILKDLGPAPPQLPRKENANTDLKLDNSFLLEESDSHNTEHLYSETKTLLFQIIKALPSSDNQKDDITVTITEARDYANRAHDAKMMEMVKRFVENCAQLVELGVLSEADNYSTLREDAIQELINYEEQLDKTEGDIVRLKEVLRSIHEHNHFLQQQMEAYKEYLDNVRANCAGGKKDKQKKEKSAKKSGSSTKKGKGQGPFKFSHKSLESDKIIVKSEVPPERKSGIQFSFSETQPGIYRVKVLYKGRFVSDMVIHLDELLEYQHNNVQTIEVEFLTLNVNLLIYLLNKHFVGGSK